MTRRAGSAAGTRHGMAPWCQVSTMHLKHPHHTCPYLQGRLLNPAVCAVGIIHLCSLHSICGGFHASQCGKLLPFGRKALGSHLVTAAP